ncbi:MAG: hypothetical protein JG773_734, partial [Spirochaeta sp.]|nr:hypothetical protein [Spirochaeta sp.]
MAGPKIKFGMNRLTCGIKVIIATTMKIATKNGTDSLDYLMYRHSSVPLGYLLESTLEVLDFLSPWSAHPSSVFLASQCDEGEPKKTRTCCFPGFSLSDIHLQLQLAFQIL